ncbi:MAG TPA: hypothetical protein ENI07_16065 [Desulfobacterales bacterium]|nr:hypothetical protein [Desulfobacterales bacterium]
MKDKTYWAVVDSGGFILFGSVRLTRCAAISSVVAEANVGSLFHNSRVPHAKQYTSHSIWERFRKIGYRAVKLQITSPTAVEMNLAP